MQALHDHRGSLGDQRQNPVDVGDPVDIDAGDPGAHRVLAVTDRCAVAHEPERWPSGEVSEQALDCSHVEQVVEQVQRSSHQRSYTPASAGELIDVTNQSRKGQETPSQSSASPGVNAGAGNGAGMSNLSDDDMTTEKPTEADDDKDAGGRRAQDAGDKQTVPATTISTRAARAGKETGDEA